MATVADLIRDLQRADVALATMIGQVRQSADAVASAIHDLALSVEKALIEHGKDSTTYYGANYEIAIYHKRITESRYNGELPNILSSAWRQQSHDFTTQWLGKVEKIGSSGLQGQDLLSYEIFVRDAKNSLEGERFPDWMMPITRPMNQVSKPWKFCSAMPRLPAYSTSCAQVSPGSAACRVLPSARWATTAIFWPRAGSFISAGESSNTTFSASSSAA